MPLHQFWISDHGDKEEIDDQLCVVLISQKTAYYVSSASARFITVTQMMTVASLLPYLLCDSWVICCHCHSAAWKLKLNWFGTVQPWNMQWVEETARVEKLCCISGRNARGEIKPRTHTQNTHKGRDTRKNRVRWKLDELKGSIKL